MLQKTKEYPPGEIIEKSERKNNSVIVREYIRDCVHRDNLQPGDKLPSEGQIAEDLKVSRNSVREATRALESIGVLEIKHGVGLVVRSFNLDAIVDIFSYGFVLDKSLIYDLYDIRKHLECSLIPKVVENISDITISKCEMILAEWDYFAHKGSPVHDFDRKFHDALYQSIGNDLLIGLCNIFWTAFKQAEQKGLLVRYTPFSMQESLSVLADHRAVLEAIKQKDVPLAIKLMESHFRELEIPN